MTNPSLTDPHAQQLASYLADQAFRLSSSTWLALAAMCEQFAQANRMLDEHGANR